jgi:hypothetical protein
MFMGGEYFKEFFMKLNQSMLISAFCTTIACMSFSTVQAASSNAATTQPAAGTATEQNFDQTSPSELAKTNKRYQVQNFGLDGSPEMRVFFIYEKDKLKYIRLGNVGGEDSNVDVTVKVLEKSHVLGHNDFITLDAPNVSKIVLEVTPYQPSAHSPMNILSPSKSYIFERNKKGLYLLHGNIEKKSASE